MQRFWSSLSWDQRFACCCVAGYVGMVAIAFLVSLT